MKKRIAIILLATLLGLSLNIFAFAANDNTQIITPYWVNIGRISGHLTVSGSTGNISIAINGDLNYNLTLEEAKLMILEELKPKKTAEFDYEMEEETEGEEDE